MQLQSLTKGVKVETASKEVFLAERRAYQTFSIPSGKTAVTRIIEKGKPVAQNVIKRVMPPIKDEYKP